MTNQDTKGEQARGPSIVYRIFLASPGDVCDERELARAVIEQIRTERALRGRVDAGVYRLGTSRVRVPRSPWRPASRLRRRSKEAFRTYRP
jgi:hypothetical protein